MATIRIVGTFVATAALAAAGTARTEMLVPTDWVAEHGRDPNVVLLQVSASRAAYDTGHIPGARFLAQQDLVVTRNGVPNELPDVAELKRVMQVAGVSDDSLVVLYGDTSLLAATRAYFTFDYLGHADQVTLLDGGLERWIREERPLESMEYPIIRGHFTPLPKPELVAWLGEVKRMPAEEALVDARSAARFKSGHIPGAVNLPASKHQVSLDDQTFKPEPELRAMYAAARVTPDRPVIVYCQTGMEATVAYFTLRYLGYDVRLYDGSMAEWELRGERVKG